MRLVGLVILLVGLVLVASVQFALYGGALMAAGGGLLFLLHHLKKREMSKPSSPRFVPVHSGGSKPAAKRSAVRRESPKPTAAAKAKADTAAPKLVREPVLDNRFEPIFEGEESSTLFSDLRNEISAGAKASLTALRDEGFVIRALADRVNVSRNNHTDVLRANAAIIDYARQLGLSGE